MRAPLFACVGALSLLTTGTLVYLAARVLTTELVLVERNGRETVLGTLPNDAFAPRLSPNGRTLAYTRSGGIIWVVDLGNMDQPRQVPALPDAQFVVWDGAGNRLFYTAAPGTNQALFFTRVDGSGFPRRPLRDPGRAADSHSLQLSALSFITLNGGDYDIHLYDERELTSRPLVAIPRSRQLSSHMSPDGRWLAYKSDETGRFEIWVLPIAGGDRTQATRGGGNNPVWSADGRELFFDDGSGLYAMDVVTGADGGTPQFGRPEALPIRGIVQSGSLRRQWNVTPDGRFLVLRR